ncbi:SDR family oxidoreductase [Rhizobium hainanense]|uniref:Uncharacterized conserved protein YbjT, contains NAD(P)-binding and DUF2867 domains n=1 Tax=Rhizobium hainanense TaxID=52131 RepID=A0A1C3W996_9HYPH|nr:SDR family NAD(P)-dependent oxidoreductase [Rhizobium hainanense]SCB36435.1 Uncharacterized conserved protein YbjT, contains NAD(P)-binding and DUF2867 domains [Rhizobium hainanense]
MTFVLVVGASGFVGRQLAQTLVSQGLRVRCLARNPSRIDDLARLGCQVVQGDLADPTSIERAVQGVDAVYISIHTLSQQSGNTARKDFADLEMTGIRHVLTACQKFAMRRVIYVTSLGIRPNATSSWTRGRWTIEQYLLRSGLEVTVIRPGQIVGRGGHGFESMVGQARKSTAFVIGNGKQRVRGIAIDDLVYYLTGVLDEQRSFGHAFDVGCDDVLTTDEMIDLTADFLGKKHPRKIHLSASLLRIVAPLIERIAKMPKGAAQGALDAMRSDLDGNPMPIRRILPRRPLPYRDAVARALHTKESLI